MLLSDTKAYMRGSEMRLLRQINTAAPRKRLYSHFSSMEGKLILLTFDLVSAALPLIAYL